MASGRLSGVRARTLHEALCCTRCCGVVQCLLCCPGAYPLLSPGVRCCFVLCWRRTVCVCCCRYEDAIQFCVATNIKYADDTKKKKRELEELQRALEQTIRVSEDLNSPWPPTWWLPLVAAMWLHVC